MSESNQSQEIDGGHGGDMSEEYPTMGGKWEERIEQKAVKQRWALSDETKAKIAARQAKIAIESEDDRRSTAAARVTVAMEAQNQLDDRGITVGEIQAVSPETLKAIKIAREAGLEISDETAAVADCMLAMDESCPDPEGIDVVE